jgi:hypothetical protein
MLSVWALEAIVLLPVGAVLLLGYALAQDLVLASSSNGSLCMGRIARILSSLFAALVNALGYTTIAVVGG